MKKVTRRNTKEKQDTDIKHIEKVLNRKKEKTKDFICISSGCNLLDCVLGGGYPVGKIVNVVGDKSTGKTFLACEHIAYAKHNLEKTFCWRYNDAESGFSFDTRSLYGFEIMPESDEQTRTVEQFRADLRDQLDSITEKNICTYVLDSLDGLSSEAELKRIKESEKAIKDGKDQPGTYAMEKQKFMSEFFRTMCIDIENKKCTLLIISQVRENIGVMFGAKYRRNGGKALDFYAHTILWLAEVEKIKKKNRTIGVVIKAKTTKAKTATPFRECFITILFSYGIDNITTNTEFLYDLRTPKGELKKKIAIDWDGSEFSTVESFVKFIEDNNLEQELTARTKQKWNEIEESIRPKRKQRYV